MEQVTDLLMFVLCKTLKTLIKIMWVDSMVGFFYTLADFRLASNFNYINFIFCITVITV